MAKNTEKKVRTNRQAKREALAGYLFLLPNFIGFFVFTAIPIVAGLVLSLRISTDLKALLSVWTTTQSSSVIPSFRPLWSTT